MIAEVVIFGSLPRSSLPQQNLDSLFASMVDCTSASRGSARSCSSLGFTKKGQYLGVQNHQTRQLQYPMQTALSRPRSDSALFQKGSEEKHSTHAIANS